MFLGFKGLGFKVFCFFLEVRGGGEGGADKLSSSITQYDGPQNTIILILGAPKTVYIILGNPQVEPRV